MEKTSTGRKTAMEEWTWKEKNPEEKKKDLFLRQKRTLDLFLERGAISRKQYEKSLGDLIEKMGMQDLMEEK